jgi:short-subunit dehydrogenase
MNPEMVLITGASSGIGRELARCFAADGSRLILVARKRHALEALSEELKRAYKTQSEVVPTDLSEPAAPARLFSYLENHGTKVDVLVNNAGFGARGEFAQLPLARQLEMVQVNMTALTHLSRLFLPGMLARGHGGVINVASLAAFQAGPGMAVYYASKAYVLSLSEAMAEELRGTGVTVTAVCPGPTETNFAAAAGGQSIRLFKRQGMSAPAVAELGYRAFRRGRVVVVTGLLNRTMALCTHLAPRSVARRVAGYLNHPPKAPIVEIR